ncbi:DUF881 domain-containing protein [Paenisporosarcina sp. TG20]|uniref:DUF881 domain-containing protein n=1 Tax=Paenisporosarcina sp. TG20 TaxID=1211706 RepID=UPI000308844F|nr:DUF881 domain-containing protein [Paenisporosarcina sp. TG20]
MKHGIYVRFTFILLIVGFMIAVQYNTVQKPESRDTRDIWEIRQELSAERQLHSDLLSKIRAVNETITTYENLQSDSPAQALNETLLTLRKKAGLTIVTSPGLELTIEPSLEAIALGKNITSISPDLLARLLNEINRFNGNDVSIDRKRIINSSPIRDINGLTTVNSLNIQTPPFKIRIGTDTKEDAELLYSHLQSSMIADDFYIDNLNLIIGNPQGQISIPAYDQPIKNNYLKNASKGD